MALVQSCLPAGGPGRPSPWRRGLSTTEVLVTVGILAILIGISVAVFSGTRRVRSQSICAANLQSIGIAFSLYSQDYQNFYPSPTVEAQWEDLLRPYTPRATFCCPADAELFAVLSSSYDWRDTGNPNTTLTGKTLLQVSHSELALTFDALPDWHQKNSIQVLRVNDSVELMSMNAFFQDIQRSPVDP
jgi:type II secretory pathway pseudopilin PulG